MQVGTHVPCRPKVLNQKSDNTGLQKGEEVGRQRRVPIIGLIFRAMGEKRSGQKPQWKVTLELSAAELQGFSVPSNISSGLLTGRETLELEMKLVVHHTG